MSLYTIGTKKRAAQSYKDLREKMGYNNEGALTRMYRPCVVRLPVKMSIIQSSLDYVDEIFLYYNDPNTVAYKALGLWNHWVRVKNQVPEEGFPKVQHYQGSGMETLSEIIDLDDGDFEETWNTAKKVKHYYAGHPEHPAAFMVPYTGKSIII